MKSNEITIDNSALFGDLLDKFGGMSKLKMFSLIEYIHKHFVGKKLIFYIRLNGKKEIRIRNITNFSIELKKCLDNSGQFEYWFRFTSDDGKCIITDSDTKISVLDLTEN